MSPFSVNCDFTRRDGGALPIAGYLRWHQGIAERSASQGTFARPTEAMGPSDPRFMLDEVISAMAI